MPKYLLLKHYRGGPEPHRPFPPMDQWAPEEVEAFIERAAWRSAKSTADVAPHQYIVKGWDRDDISEHLEGNGDGFLGLRVARQSGCPRRSNLTKQAAPELTCLVHSGHVGVPAEHPLSRVRDEYHRVALQRGTRKKGL